jgi:Spy/CpxP family protein refolding chaperone
MMPLYFLMLKRLLLASALVLVTAGLALCNSDCMKVNWEHLELNDQQRSQIKEVDSQWRSKASGLFPRLQQKQDKLNRLMREPEANPQQVMQLQQEVHQDKMELNMHATQLYLNKKRILSPVQRQKLEHMLEAH